MKKFYFLWVVFFWALQLGFGQNTIKTMVYNLLEFPSAPPANRELILKDIFTNYLPDLFMVNELQNEAGANLILNQTLLPLAPHYARSTFAPNQSSSFQDLNQMVFYNTEKLLLEDEELFETTVRDINHFTFKLNTADQASNPIFLHVYVTHLKADDGTVFDDDQQDRLNMVNVFTDALNLIPADSFVLFAGDFNFKSSAEAAYQEILDPTNNVILVDPVNRPGNWNNNSSFTDVHTQATRTSTVNFGNRGAGGGLDDRFDFIMMSQNFTTHPDFFYNTGSYKAFGNNGNCFNLNINDAACTGAFDQTLRESLFNMSDHLPVVAEFTLNAPLLNLEAFEPIPLLQFASGNVVSSELELLINLAQLPENASLSAYNLLGQKVFTQSVGSQSRVNVPVSGLSAGVYLLKISGQSRTWKFIKR
ncbi:MAG: T9SS type A sorting domain-containing protein [Flavobacteriaceae bacterium]|nr:T9SS type A sorting domain-containing protein [Flavobacteriaceae bacterium]